MLEQSRAAELVECMECRRIWDDLAEVKIQAFALQNQLETARLSGNAASELLILPRVRDNAEDCGFLERLLALHEQEAHSLDRLTSTGSLASRSAVVR
jgi:hypothetical protein